ncbi:DUF6308 family protein [Cryptosporangium phraense]|uniref:Uncharacterized protein n=1 Tax=Cryptosporangium phraense TaxID=2593070 RepID=A0A545AFQ7_9ACTN|nr:DUF6308 family protein [Cryptosporangium phraense]TQS40176.1 hypothetical protein FL583_36240 [Cryptosporangium phraense]
MTETAPDYQFAHHTLDRFVYGDLRQAAVINVGRYFNTDLYPGARFERLDGGGDRPEVAHQFTASDIMAVRCLGTDVKPVAAIAILEMHGNRLSALLRRIPHTPLHDAPKSEIDGSSAAGTLASMLISDDFPHLGRMTATKLMARKRPHLLPTYDIVVARVLGKPRDITHCLHGWFHADPERAKTLAAMRDEIGGISDISLLRILDSAIWMHGMESTVH